MAIEWRVEVVGSVESTQNPVHNKAIGGEEEGFVLQALTQTGARGRHGNKWDAPMGNLYMSMLLRPECSLNDAGQLSFVTAVALSRAMDNHIDPDKHQKTLKWPNDILVDGLKISGILLESNLMADGSLDSIVLGVGVNIFKAPELAIDMQSVSHNPIYVNVFRDAFLEQFSSYCEIWKQEGFTAIQEAWLKQAHGLNSEITVRLPQESFKGVFKGIDERGALAIEMPDGEQRIVQAGDVHFAEE